MSDFLFIKDQEDTCLFINLAFVTSFEIGPDKVKVDHCIDHVRQSSMYYYRSIAAGKSEDCVRFLEQCKAQNAEGGGQ